MIGTSRLEYIFIQTCIVGLHYLVPLCILYCATVFGLYGFQAFTWRLPLVIEIVAIAETLFFFLAFLPYRAYLQREAVHPPPPTRAERRELFQLCNDNISDAEGYVRKWFLGAELEDIKKENLKDFLLWAFFNRGGPPGEDNEELEIYVAATEKLLGRKLEEGRGKAKALRLTLDKVDMMHRSLVWYFCIGFVDFLTYVKLLYYGFHFHRTSLSRFFTLFPLRPSTLFTRHRSPAKHTTYWHRPHTSLTKLPVVFIHGIGIGLYPYTNLMRELNSTSGLETSDPDDQVGILLIEIMPISSRITHAPLSRQELCAEIDQIVTKEFGPTQRFVLITHSYGSIINTHLLKTPAIAPRIGPIVLIDPVTILLHLPDVAYNFTRRKPVRANEHQLYYFASMDIGIAHSLGRHFFWNENILWKKDLIGHKTTVSLGGRDLIVNTEAVGRYVSSKSVDRETSITNDDDNLIEFDQDADFGRGLVTGGDDGRLSSEATLVGDDYGEEWKFRDWKGEDIDLLWFENLDHAQAFDKAGTRRRILEVVRAYCLEG